MKTRIFAKVAIICLLIVIIMTTGGLFATWNYVFGDPDNIQREYSIHRNTVSWVLPDDKETGESHQVLLELIINGENGLNTENSYLNEQIENRKKYNKDTFANNDFWQGETTSSTFETEINNLDFMLYFPDEDNTQEDESLTEMYIFTTAVYLGETTYLFNTDLTIPIGEYVYAIYRTKIQKNAEGKWYAVDTELGAAPSMLYQNTIAGSLAAKTPSFNPAPEVWYSGKRGTNFNDAIHTYVHIKASKDSSGELFANIDGYELSTHFADTADEKVYYQYSAESTKTYTLKIMDENANVSVYNSNLGKVSATTKKGDGYTTITVRLTIGSLYYFEISGMSKAIYTFY